MPKGFGVGLQVAAIPVAGVEPLSPEQTAPPGGSPPSGGSSGGGEAAGGLGGIGLIALLLLALGIGIPALVAAPDDEEAQVQPASSEEDVSVRVTSRGGIAR